MKIITIVSIIILLLFFAKNLFSVVAEENYTVIKKLEDIEIRRYKNSIYASYIPKNEKERNNSFKKVASFIFGDNTSNEKISMTSPVVIKIHNNYGSITAPVIICGTSTRTGLPTQGTQSEGFNNSRWHFVVFQFVDK